MGFKSVIYEVFSYMSPYKPAVSGRWAGCLISSDWKTLWGVKQCGVGSIGETVWALSLWLSHSPFLHIEQWFLPSRADSPLYNVYLGSLINFCHQIPVQGMSHSHCSVNAGWACEWISGFRVSGFQNPWCLHCSHLPSLLVLWYSNRRFCF